MADDLTGQRYGQLLVVRRTAERIARSVVWECRCDCGNTKLTSANRLKTGHCKSCGCLNLKAQWLTHTTHGMAHTPTWTAWKDMKARCFNPKLRNYKNYGGRGITVCSRWLQSFKNFLSDMGERPDGLTLERKNNNGNYEPGNCKWANRSDQCKNTRPRARTKSGQYARTI